MSTQPYLSCSSYRAWSVWSSPTQLQESHRPACPTSTLPLPGLALQHYSQGKAPLLSPLSSLLTLALWFRYHGLPRPSHTVVYRDSGDVMDQANLGDALRTQDRDRIVSPIEIVIVIIIMISELGSLYQSSAILPETSQAASSDSSSPYHLLLSIEHNDICTDLM